MVKYSYDAYNRLIAVEKYAGASETAPYSKIAYSYDWAGRMIERNADGSITRHTYQGVNLMAEYDANGAVLASYSHLPGEIDHPVLMKRDDRIFYYIYDELGSVVQLTNEQGRIVKEYKYDSFGRIVLEVGDLTNPFTYTGRQWDTEARLYHYRARVYDPENGTFLTQDPIYSINPYSYVENDPLNFIDPLGLMACRKEFTAYSSGWGCMKETCITSDVAEGPRTGGYYEDIRNWLEQCPNRDEMNYKQHSEMWIGFGPIHCEGTCTKCYPLGKMPTCEEFCARSEDAGCMERCEWEEERGQAGNIAKYH